MRITARKRADQTTGTTLVGRLRDQAELSGVLNSLYDLHLSILKVEVVDGEQQKLGSEKTKEENKSGEQQP